MICSKHNLMMNYPVVQHIVPVAFLFALWTAPAVAEIYKCRDTNGRIQYADKPCAGESSVFTPKQAPVVDAGRDERRQKTRKLLDAMEAERSLEKKAAAEQQAEKERRQRNCDNARNYYRQITISSQLYDLDKEGNRVILNDAQRAQSTEQARAAVERWCNEY